MLREGYRVHFAARLYAVIAFCVYISLSVTSI